MLDTIWLEIEHISLRELLLKYPTINKEETAQCLHELLKRKGISIKCVQEYLGLACVQSVYQWLDGKKLPSLDNLYALTAVSSTYLSKPRRILPIIGWKYTPIILSSFRFPMKRL